MIGKYVQTESDKCNDESSISPRSSISSISFTVMKESYHSRSCPSRYRTTMSTGSVSDENGSQMTNTSDSLGTYQEIEDSMQLQVTLSTVYQHRMMLDKKELDRVDFKLVWKNAHKYLWAGNKIIHETDNLKWWSEPMDIDKRKAFSSFFRGIGYGRTDGVWRGRFWNSVNSDIRKTLLGKRSSVIQIIQKRIKDGKYIVLF